MITSQLDDLKDAYHENSAFYHENLLMMQWYVRRMVDTMKTKNFKTLLSLGIGHRLVSITLIEHAKTCFDNYKIIEGSPEIIKKLKNGISIPANVEIINDLFENYRSLADIDGIEMGFVLEHVDEPLKLLKQYKHFLSKNGAIYIVVPNATSLHRQLGHKAGILSDLYQLSSQDLKFGHKRYFDVNSISQLVLDAGLKIEKCEGVFLKPISTSQLTTLNLSANIIESFYKVGVHYPELSNAVYIEAVL